MPGLDGTGPRGRGPITGKGRGFCILKVSGEPNEPLSGFVGRSGVPVRFGPDGIAVGSVSLRLWAELLEAELREIRLRITALEREKRIRNS